MKFREKGAGPYLAGMWKTDLLRSLLWSRTKSSGLFDEVLRGYRAPSWSWASVDSPSGNYRETSPYRRNIKRFWSTVTDAKCYPKGSDDLAAVVDGYAEICGPVAELLLGWEGSGYPGRINYDIVPITSTSRPSSTLSFHPSNSRRGIFRCFGYLDEPGRAGPNLEWHHCLFLGESGLRGHNNHWGLIIQGATAAGPGGKRLNFQPGRGLGQWVNFQRIGWFRVVGDLSFTTGEMSTVTLV